MARRSKRNKLIQTVIGLIILLIIVIIGNQNENIEKYFFNTDNIVVNTITAQESENVILEGKEILQIYFFDVGQADSILLISDDKTMLIDAGNNEDGKLLVNNIKRLGIKKLDYIIGTHPHEDHIGGLDNIINAFEIGTIFMPKIQTNTKTFEDVLDAISNKNLDITSPKVGYKFMVGKAECEIMLCGSGSNKEQKNMNLSSIVIRTTYGNQSYLFTGDAEEENEQSINWPQTNVLKIGHHGSDTSSSQSFLNQIKPQIAIIQVGKDNNYGHPKQVVLDRLNKLGTLIYRTDEKGNILLESDGENNKVSFY